MEGICDASTRPRPGQMSAVVSEGERDSLCSLGDHICKSPSRTGRQCGGREGGHVNRASTRLCCFLAVWPPPCCRRFSSLRVFPWKMEVRRCATPLGCPREPQNWATGSLSPAPISTGEFDHRLPQSHIRDAGVTAPAAVEMCVFWLPNISDNQNPWSWGWDMFPPPYVNTGWSRRPQVPSPVHTSAVCTGWGAGRTPYFFFKEFSFAHQELVGFLTS